MFPNKDAERRQCMEMLAAAIETQARACKITERKIQAVQDKRDAQYKVHTAIAAMQAIDGNEALARAYVELRLAESCLLTAEREQLELYQVNELANLQRLKDEVERLQNEIGSIISN